MQRDLNFMVADLGILEGDFGGEGYTRRHITEFMTRQPVSKSLFWLTREGDYYKTS